MTHNTARCIAIRALLGAAALASLTARAGEPSTRPADGLKTIEVPALLSPDPKQFVAAKDPTITRLIEAHNANQDRLEQVTLRGQCVWNLDGNPGRPRPMLLHYTRAGATATLTCGQDSCTVQGSRITASADSLVHTDALYLLMFRKYNPGGFDAGPPGRIGGRPSLVARSETESLEFHAESGRLVRATVRTALGPVTANFEGFITVDSNGQKAVLPTRVWLNVPDGFFPEGWADNATITLTIDPAGSTVARQRP